MSATQTEVRECRQPIGEWWVDARVGRISADTDPLTGDVLAAASRADAVRAVQAVTNAFAARVSMPPAMRRGIFGFATCPMHFLPVLMPAGQTADGG